MDEKVLKTLRIFAANFAIENFKTFIYNDSFRAAEIHTEDRSILLSIDMIQNL